MVATAQESGAHTGSTARQAVIAAVVGNVLEWYDFSVYAFVATFIARKFFPGGDEVAGLLAAFALYGIGFLARPLGGIVIGRIGDLRGRKAALVLTILLMAVGTTAIGLIPSYATIGLAAPALLVIARLMQGFSAAANGAARPPSSSNGRPRAGAASTAVSSRRAWRPGSCSARRSRR